MFYLYFETLLIIIVLFVAAFAFLSLCIKPSKKNVDRIVSEFNRKHDKIYNKEGKQ